MAAILSDAALGKSLGLTPAQVRELKTRRGLTTQLLAKMPNAVLRHLLRRLPLGDLPEQRAAFRYHQSRDERCRVAPGAYSRALVRRRAEPPARTPRTAGIPSGPRIRLGRAMPPPTAGLDPGHTGWTAIGPGNIGGRIRSIAVDPGNPARLWVGSVGGGIWLTTDSGASWAPVDDLLANLAVSCIAMDPSNSSVIYAGTGEGFFNVDAIRGAGVFQTIDGTNWKQLSATTTADFQSVNRIAVAADGSVVLAATATGIFRSSDADRQTWASVLAGDIAFVACHPTDATKAIAGSLRDGTAYYSTDSGATWTAATHAGTWNGRIELCYAAKDPTGVYASVNVNGGEIWQSGDGGMTYQKKNSIGPDGTAASYLGDQGWYGNTIWAGDPTNADFMLVGGINLWRSTDGGATLVDISTWYDSRSCHADHHQIVSDAKYDGSSNKRVYFGNDGGIYTTADATTVGNDTALPRINGWARLDNSFGVTQFYSGAGNVSSGTIVGGAQDNGTLTFTPGGGAQKWGTLFGGDGGFCAADPSDATVFYGEYVYLSIFRSLDSGASGEYVSGQYYDPATQSWLYKQVPFQIPDATNKTALFIAPFVVDPQTPARILAGGQSLWRTNDAKTPNSPSSGPSWSSIKSNVGSSNISAIAIAPGNSDVVWVGYDDGKVFQTSSGTAASPSWQQVDNTGSNPLTAGRYCTRICIDPTDSNTVYVAFGGYSPGNVWKTTDGGQNWANVGGALPSVPVRALAVHPSKPSFLYLGSEVGLYASEDAGTTWSPTNEGPTNCSVDDLFWMGMVLVAVTHGRGMFTIDLSAAAANAPAVTSISPTSGPATGGTSVTVTGTGFSGVISVGFGGTAVNPQTGATDTQVVVVSPGGTGTVDLTVTTPPGTSATSGSDQFTYTAVAPTVSGISPSSGPAAGGTSVTITGTGFTGVTSVGFGDTGVNVQSGNTDTQLVVVSPGGTGTVDLTVTTPSGTSATSANDQFTYV